MENNIINLKPQFHPQKVILSQYAAKNVVSYGGGVEGGGSCDFQPSFGGESLSFVPNGRGGLCVF